MEFKTEKERDEFWQLKPKAKWLLCYADYLSYEFFGRGILVTKIFYKGGSGVHEDWRAFDIRRINYYTKEEVVELADFVNGHFQYDPSRKEMKSCVVEGSCLHFQVWVR